jgi:hypothetical protein
VDEWDFHVAVQAAGVIGIDPWETVFDRLQKGDDYWDFVMQTDDPARIDRVVQYALTTFDLDSIATGPADEMGMGPQWDEHRKLDSVVQYLRRFPGRGWPLIRASLQSPLVRNRTVALQTIAGWDQDTWTDEIRNALAAAADAEPSDDVRELIRIVRAGEPYEYTKLCDLLQNLHRFPGYGWSVIRAGLQSSLIGTRTMALQAIAAWDQDTWTDEIRNALAVAADAEPSDDVRELIRKIRAGEPLVF